MIECGLICEILIKFEKWGEGEGNCGERSEGIPLYPFTPHPFNQTTFK